MGPSGNLVRKSWRRLLLIPSEPWYVLGVFLISVAPRSVWCAWMATWDRRRDGKLRFGRQGGRVGIDYVSRLSVPREPCAVGRYALQEIAR